MYLGYNTNGLAHHDLFDAVELLHEIGYRGVAITIDHNVLSPKDPRCWKQVSRLRRLLERLGMRSVIETGARYLLDPRVKHEPTLLSEDCRSRIEFYRHAISCAAMLGSDCVSIWSGENRAVKSLFPEAGSDKTPGSFVRLAERLQEVFDFAATMRVPVGFEPEPGMLVDTMQAFQELLRQFEPGDGDAGQIVSLPRTRQVDNLHHLTLDIGHLQCQGEVPIAEVIRRWAPRLVNVHIEDMRRGVHEHLMFGEGEIDFPPVLRALTEVGYAGGVYVELSRHSHVGPEAAKKAFEFLTSIWPEALA
ncbi:MAG: sugar phosphate isomerase/epimerase [Planctomycetaceae bacterium]|nr:sugar phosphate isomerase/epimerase [Planctomycetaceae bacterium]